MKFAGKLIGAILGFALLRNPMGIAIGLALGHAWDAGWIDLWLPVAGKEGAFLAPLFALAGALAKADGQVSQAEIAVVEALMGRIGLDGAQRKRAIQQFNLGKSEHFRSRPAARDLRKFCGYHGQLKSMLIEVLVEVACADREGQDRKRALLRDIADELDVDARVLDDALSGKHANDQTGHVRAYLVLGVSPTASDEEIRKAYRRLMAKHHPDRLAAKSLSGAELKMAEEKAREINAAYDDLKASRGMK